MWRYVKSAFLVGIDVPGLGRIPLNALAACGIGVLGFGEHAIWLLGLGIETAVISSLAFNKRFQNWVDATSFKRSDDQVAAESAALLKVLPADSKARLTKLQAKCEQTLQMYRNLQSDEFEFTIETNREALKKLQRTYLKLLVARQHLVELDSPDAEQGLKAQIVNLEADLKDSDDSPGVHDSKTATLNILKKRLNNLARKAETLEEIDSDLTRIEAQVDLVRENAGMQSKPQTISADIELASDLVSGGLLGDDLAEVRPNGSSAHSRRRVTEQ
ncbi:MAG TPA: hypothetical protein VNX88_04240 [Terriglobales bacterium]|nr:hypothetical protein [Terriglobales bacterium]